MYELRVKRQRLPTILISYPWKSFDPNSWCFFNLIAIIRSRICYKPTELKKIELLLKLRFTGQFTNNEISAFENEKK